MAVAAVSAQTTAESHEALLEQAQEGRIAQAIAGLQDLLRQGAPKRGEAARILSDLGVLKFQLGDCEGALTALLDALRRDPRQPDALANLELLAESDAFRAALARAWEEERQRIAVPLPDDDARTAVLETREARFAWPGWATWGWVAPQLERAFAVEFVQTGGIFASRSRWIEGARDTRLVSKPLFHAALVGRAAVAVTEDAAHAALAHALGVPALLLSADGLFLDGRRIGDEEDEIGRIPIEAVVASLARALGEGAPELGRGSLPESLAALCRGRGIEIGHGGRKKLGGTVGIDEVRAEKVDLLARPGERPVLPDDAFDFAIVHEGVEATPAHLANWMRPLRTGGQLLLLGREEPDALGVLPDGARAEFSADHALVLVKSESPRFGRAENFRLNEQEMADRALELTSTPTYLEISSTIVCNINTPPCVQCWKHSDPRLGFLKADQRHLNRRSFDRIAPYMNRANTLSLHGIGEPLANPALFDYIEFVDDEADSFFVTNALLLDAARIDKLLSSKLRAIDVSIDAATAETYRKIRHHDFDRVVSNIRNFIAERDRRGREKPRLMMNMTLMRENVHELPDFIRLAHDLGADSTHALHLNKGVSYRVGWFDYEAQHCENDPEAHDAAVEEAYRVAEELGIEFALTGKRRLSASSEAEAQASTEDETAGDGSGLTMYQGTEIDGERFFCPKPWSSALIDNDGNVSNCCWQARSLGNLRTSTFEELWNGETAQEIRRMTAEGKPHPNCRNSGNVCPWLGRV